MKTYRIHIALTVILLFSCSTKEESIAAIKPKVFAITVSDMNESMDWYAENLLFEPDTIVNYQDYGLSVGMLHMGDFFLELVEFDKSLSKNELQLPDEKTELNGFFKMGFQSNQITKLYEELSNKGVNIVAPLDKLSPIENYPWPKEYFLIADPDGNYIQFFSMNQSSSENKLKIQPFLMALATPDIDASISWYTNYLNASMITPKVGELGNQRVLMDINGFILELGQFAGYSDFGKVEGSDSLSNAQIHGIKKLSFTISNIDQLESSLKSKAVVFDFPLSDTNNSMVGKQHFMIQDQSGNSIQFFSTDDL